MKTKTGWYWPFVTPKVCPEFGIFVTDYLNNTGYQKNTDMECITSSECRGAHRAVRDTLDVVGGKWKLVILTALIDKKRRFKELARTIGVTPRILSKELQELEMNKLISRTVCDTRPITVEYALTEHGRTLGTVLSAMRDWGLMHREEIVGKQEPSSDLALA